MLVDVISYVLSYNAAHTHIPMFFLFYQTFSNTVNISLHRLIPNNSIERYVSNSGHVVLTLKILALI